MIITDTKYNLNNEIVINNIYELKSIKTIPDIIIMNNVNSKEEYRILLKYLKLLKNKILIINDNNKYLKNIFLKNLDIYRYGNNIYDDIEYIKKENNIIFKYGNKKYEISINDEKVLGYILIKLVCGNNIEEIVNSLEKTI